MKVNTKFLPEGFLFIAIAIALFYRSGLMPLSADEPIRALVALDMLLNHHFLAPEMNGDLYLNKPPLYNWILLAFFKLTGSFSEWVIRLPSLLSMLLFVPVIVKIGRKYTTPKVVWMVAFAFITSGNLWFYSSYLGHIDVLFSLITFLQIYSIIHYGLRQQWWSVFVISYVLAAIGFMMKGLPSIAFQGATLLAFVLVFKRFKQLFTVAHMSGAIAFIMPILIYVMAYSRQGDAGALLEKLLHESTSRTVTDKSLVESVAHIFSFPFLFLADIMPWGIFALVFLKREIRRHIWSSRFLRACITVFLANIVIYWLSPDYRARYVFMLIPFFLFPIFEAMRLLISKLNSMIFKLFAVLALLLGLAIPLFVHRELPELSMSPMLVLGVLLFASTVLLWKVSDFKNFKSLYSMVAILIVFRLIYSSFMVPYRIATGPYQAEKLKAQQIAHTVGQSPLHMYHSNVSLTMNWYLSVERRQIVTTKRNDFQLDAFYLVPDDVLIDSNNVQVFDTFVRRFEHKPFSLVKFKEYFPQMPKKK